MVLWFDEEEYEEGWLYSTDNAGIWLDQNGSNNEFYPFKDITKIEKAEPTFDNPNE